MTTATFRLYVHDDLTDDVTARHGPQSEALRLARELMALVARDSGRVTVLTLEQQLRALAARGPFPPFPLAVGIGGAGERVARHVHARTGWFPRIARVDATREEDGGGGYRVVSCGAQSLAAQLEVARDCPAVALVDDTAFSGITVETLLDRLPVQSRPSAHVICLRGVGETLARLRTLCPVTAGFEAPGRMLSEVSFINASGLVRRGSIRRAGRPPLAFFERPEWIAEWFPDVAPAVVEACRALNEILDGPPMTGPHPASGVT